MPVICKKCYWCAEHVGNINLLANTGLFIIKLIGGIFGRSQALIADALHSTSDVVVSLLLVAGLKITGAPPDDDHQWGHGNIEYIVSAVIGVLLLFAGTMITIMAIISMFEGAINQPGILAVWAAIISVVSNEMMYRHSMCIGKQMESPAMIANAWENRADVYSSLAALIGVFGARLGFSFLDPVAAIVVGYMIGRSALTTLISAINAITDASLDKEELNKIKAVITKEPKIKSVISLRVRKVGQKIWIDLEAKFDPYAKVAEVREIIKRVSDSVEDQMENVGGIHIVPRATLT